MRPHGWLGLVVILGGEALLFVRVEPVVTWFTPIAWTGYILLLDALLAGEGRPTLLTARRREFAAVVPLSIGFWLVFETYNLWIQNWEYVDIPMPVWVGALGSAWAYATIFPGLLLSAEWLAARRPFREMKTRPIRVRRMGLAETIALGLALLAIPFFVPAAWRPYTFAPVWVGFLLVLDPLADRLGGPSFAADLEEGRPGRFLAWFVGGYWCGLLWEFWNYWAGAKWIYTVPITAEIKIFEMPLAGFLGFGPFALEYGALHNLLLTRLRRRPDRT